MEFRAARDKLKKWHGQGEKVLDRYLDERDTASSRESRLTLFTANVDTQQAMLYGKVPKSDVTRTFSDADDDVARVAAMILERNIDQEMEKESDTFAQALEHALEDRLLPGLGFCTVRYEMEEVDATDPETGEALADPESGEAIPEKTWENVATDWHYWKAVLYSPCRTFEEMRWGAWSEPLTRKQLRARFGDEIANSLPMNSKTGKKGDADAAKADPWSRADVWEIWSKDDGRVYWFVEGAAKILDMRDDPLELDGFFPFPKPMIAHATTRAFVPKPDYTFAQDLYGEIDKLTTRIGLLEDAVRVTGVYDKNSAEVARILTESGVNKLYPAENWSGLSEKGGLKGAVDWFPLDQIVAAIGVLTEKRAEKIGLLQQVTGWSDIMRGQSNASETLGAQKLKSAYGSVRIQRFQAEFAQFASALRTLKAEIIAKHFDPKTIIQRSNIMSTPDAKFAEAAVALIKSPEARFRVEVKPESINLTDYATLKQERVEVIGALGQLLGAMTPLIQSGGPPAMEFTLATGAWLLAGVKGGEGLEAEYDKFRDQVQKAAAAPKPHPPPDPKVEAAKVQGAVKIEGAKMDLQVKAAEHRMDMAKLGAEVQADKTKTMLRVVEAQATPPEVPRIP